MHKWGLHVKHEDNQWMIIVTMTCTWPNAKMQQIDMIVLLD